MPAAGLFGMSLMVVILTFCLWLGPVLEVGVARNLLPRILHYRLSVSCRMWQLLQCDRMVCTYLPNVVER